MRSTGGTTSETDKTFEQIFENINDGITLIDTESKKFVLCNRAMGRILGYQKDELLKLSLHDVYSGKTPPASGNLFGLFKGYEAETGYDIPVLTKENHLLYVDISAAPLQYKGRPHMVATFRKTAEHKNAENGSIHDRELLKTTLNTAADGILLVDNKKKISHINRRFIEMWNIPQDIADTDDDNTMLGYILNQLEDPAGFMEKVEYLYNSDLESFDEVKFSDGRVFERYSSPLINEGVKFGRVWDFKDITARKRTEEDLRKSEAVMRTLFDAAPVGISLLVNRIHIKINSMLCTLTGYTPEELLGQSTEMLYHTKDEADRVAAKVYPEIKQRGFSMTEANLKRKDGSAFHSLLCLRAIEPDNTEAGIIAISLDISDLKRAEEALKESESLLRSIFEASPSGISLHNHDRTITKLNSVLCRITGYSEDELLGRTTRHLYFGDADYNRVGETYNLMRREGLGMAESLLRRKDGSAINVLICLSPVDPADPSSEVIATVLDITSLKHAEIALRESEEKYHTIVDNIQDAIYRSDLNGYVVFATPSAARILGYSSADEITGMNLARNFYYYPEKRDEFLQILHEKGEVTQYEVTLKRRGGSPVVVSVSSHYYRDRNGEIIGVEGMFSDITERKKTEEALLKNETMLRSLLNATPVGVSLLKNRVHIKVNDSLCRILGYSEQELLGQSTRVFYNTDEDYKKVESMYRQMENEGTAIKETQLKHKDGTLIDTILCLSPFDMNDKSAGVILTILDITEQKKMEEERNRLEEMLLHSQKIESIGRLAGGIAHDFNNLLTAIMGNTEMAMLQLDPAGSTYSRLSVIKKATEGAAALTRQLLAFSRKQVIEPRIISLNDVVEHVYKMILTLIGENIRAHLILPEKLPAIKADPGQVEQIIINLVTNSRDAMPDGGELIIETGEIFLDDNYSRTHHGVAPGKYVMMGISDTGAGMDQETLEHAFEPFYTTKETGHGTGLGLATVYGIVKQNGGTIEVYSEIKQGTVFKVYFPVSSLSQENFQSIQEKPIRPTGNETILIAEDKYEVLEFCREVLNRSGYNVLTAENGEGALSISEKYSGRIHLFMTDIILPGISGRLTAEKILISRPDIKILYNSGYTAEMIDKEGILEKGINFISKPFTTQELSVKVREVLDK